MFLKLLYGIWSWKVNVVGVMIDWQLVEIQPVLGHRQHYKKWILYLYSNDPDDCTHELNYNPRGICIVSAHCSIDPDTFCTLQGPPDLIGDWNLRPSSVNKFRFLEVPAHRYRINTGPRSDSHISLAGSGMPPFRCHRPSKVRGLRPLFPCWFTAVSSEYNAIVHHRALLSLHTPDAIYTSRAFYGIVPWLRTPNGSCGQLSGSKDQLRRMCIAVSGYG